MKLAIFKTILFALTHVLRHTAKRSPQFAEHMRKQDCIVQIRLKDNSAGRYYTFKGGYLRSQAGIHPRPDVDMIFKDLATALMLLKPPVNRAESVHAAKNFRVMTLGRNDLCIWFMQMMNALESTTLEYGTKMSDGTTRYTHDANGGPTFVYVKDGKIVRTTPIEFDDSDAPSWKVTARGKTFSPERRLVPNPHALSMKSLVHSDKRILYPMKRVDFDPNGERNPQNRGISGYERISWDEALDIVVGEIKRQKTVHGPGAIALYFGSHHQWGNVGYYLSALLRFGNLIGFTRIHPNPDSWEGWYWGAQHHYGSSLRVGIPSFCGTMEDCLKEAELIVFWSSDPESTGGSYGAFEGTQRRQFAKDIGIEMVHIDPNLNYTASLLGGKWIPIVPGTDPALAHAIAYVWMTEGLYDTEYVATRTTGFDKYQAYVLGQEDGIPKTPEWQAPETGVPAATVRALARKWGTKKTYLAAGGKGTTFGGACRSATGSQWARSMVCLMAMQGLGKPGVNFGNLQYGAPVDLNFYFPGYGEGGISGDVETTGAVIQQYQRQPQLPSMNIVTQRITRNRIAEALLTGKTEGYPIDPKSQAGQFMRFGYPSPGHSRVHMLYKYGGSHFGTVQESNRLAEAYRTPELEFVVNQSIWHEGESKFADVILPACTNFERWDIGEWTVAGGYSHHNNCQLNYRVISIQHPCVPPLGESKSDYQIFLALMHRLGMGTYYSEGQTELDWCKAQFEASDLPKRMSWEKFLQKGYYVVPPEDWSVSPQPIALRWYAEGRQKDMPEPHPLPAGFGRKFREDLQTQSGKIEFEANSLKKFDDLGRPVPADGMKRVGELARDDGQVFQHEYEAARHRIEGRAVTAGQAGQPRRQLPVEPGLGLGQPAQLAHQPGRRGFGGHLHEHGVGDVVSGEREPSSRRRARVAAEHRHRRHRPTGDPRQERRVEIGHRSRQRAASADDHVGRDPQCPSAQVSGQADDGREPPGCLGHPSTS